MNIHALILLYVQNGHEKRLQYDYKILRSPQDEGMICILYYI